VNRRAGGVPSLRRTRSRVAGNQEMVNKNERPNMLKELLKLASDQIETRLANRKDLDEKSRSKLRKLSAQINEMRDYIDPKKSPRRTVRPRRTINL
jgi:hypothetical protein